MKKETKVNLTDKAIRGFLKTFSATLKDGEFCTPETYKSECFYKGNEKFLKNPSKNGKWSLGYCDVNLTPLDYFKHDYYLGGYISPDNGFKNLVEGILDDMKARIIVLDDGSDRGVNVFCTVDCIGMTNGDIRGIRKKFAEAFKEKFPDELLSSVNVFSTHTHSCVDTEGLWTDFPGKMLRNIHRNRTGKGVLEKGTDEQYMRFLTKSVCDGMIKACLDRKKGELYLAQKELSDKYFVNKNRPSATGLLTVLTRLTFIPDDKNATPTMIVNMPAHPDVAGLPTSDGKGSGRELCGDYIHYMGELLGEAGFNFMFFNGAICAIYMARGLTTDGQRFTKRYQESVRFGREIARIALALTKNLDEIKKDRLLYDEEVIAKEKAIGGEQYTLWCENWEPVTETKVKPLLNLRLKEIKAPVTNHLIIAAGKLRLANYKVIKDGKRGYFIYTEIGYLELGEELAVAFVPGEFCCDLLLGGASLTSEGSVSKTPFPYPTLREMFGENLIAFGLANDAVGYIVPDNDYTMGDPEDHYHELISLGQYVGSSVMKGFKELKEEIDNGKK